ncbi:uncharacterized protein LOC135497817 [Lineus longissimus]|uniref:uncharacterized protein LOC135497817 n=1 Tax=Lineus longissimus TaxID=88925 RepID=UPI002B4EB998
MAYGNPVKLAVIIVTFLVFLVTLAFNALAGTGIKAGIFQNSTGDVSNYFYLEITPAGWTFSIWGFIYVWQALWLTYAVSTLCRVSDCGYLYVHPAAMPTSMYLVYLVNNVANIAWLLVWDRFLVTWALVCISLLPITLDICIVLCYRNLDRGQGSLFKQGLGKEVWFIRIFTENGLAIYATWTTIATLLNTAMVLTYELGLAVDVASTVALGILTVLIAVWVSLDLFVIDRYSRFTFTPYLVIIAALVGSISQNWNPTGRNSIFTAVLLGVACFATVVKLILMIYRQITRPLVDSADTVFAIKYSSESSTMRLI